MVPKPDESLISVHLGPKIDLGAMMLRASHMVSACGETGETRDFQVKRFHAIMCYLGTHSAELGKEFVLIDDGEQMVFPHEVLAAVHESFLPEPLPSQSSVDVQHVIDNAKRKVARWTTLRS